MHVIVSENHNINHDSNILSIEADIYNYYFDNP